jgi:hypothetical protein
MAYNYHLKSDAQFQLKWTIQKQDKSSIQMVNVLDSKAVFKLSAPSPSRLCPSTPGDNFLYLRFFEEIKLFLSSSPSPTHIN